jgi:hypothetical protein
MLLNLRFEIAFVLLAALDLLLWDMHSERTGNVSKHRFGLDRHFL